MDQITSQVFLRETMKQHVEQLLGRVSEGRVLSALHIHVNMKQDDAQDFVGWWLGGLVGPKKNETKLFLLHFLGPNGQDLVDYLRFQLEWCAEELGGALNEKPETSGVHILALVVHGIRGSHADQCIRPFLLAGPTPHEGDAEMSMKILEWTGVSVDHFSHLLPWGMRSEELFEGSIKQIFGLQEETTERFGLVLADALPHVVPKFGYEAHHADSFTIVKSLMEEIYAKAELVRCIRAVLAEQLSREQAWDTTWSIPLPSSVLIGTVHMSHASNRI